MKNNKKGLAKKKTDRNTVLNAVGGAVKWKDFLKKGAKLKARKLTKKEIEQVNADMEKAKEFFKQMNRPLTWEELHTPMDI